MKARQFVRRWGTAIALAVIALVSWQLAQRGDTDEASLEPVVYDRALSTPMLSARRLPRTLQAPVVDAAIAPSLQTAIDGSPPSTCLVVQVGDRLLTPTGNASTPLVPASNQKVITTFVALDVLGPDFRFVTRAQGDTAPVGGILEGNLYLIGGGDPFLSTGNWWAQYDNPDGRHHTRLEELADRVVAAGVAQITGSVVGDETLYDSERQGPWAERLISGRQSGPLSALTVNEGFVDWPAVFAESARSRSPTDNPPLHAASIFAQLLGERGVTIAGPPSVGQAPAGVELAAVESPPLSDIATHVNSFSSNIGAELLLKRLGLELAQQGSIQAGAQVAVSHLTAIGIPVEGLQIDDGSGLAESNRVTCQTLATILATAGPDSALAASMSIGGTRGSLEQRFIDTPAAGRVLAKTGTLNGVRALSGYVHSAIDAELSLTFAYVANDEQLIGSETIIGAIQDALMVALTDYPGRPSAAELAPLATTSS